MKTSTKTINEFSKFFRKQLRDPLIGSIIGSNTEKFKPVFEEELPQVVHDSIVSAERRIHATGMQKAEIVAKEVYDVLKPYGLEVVMGVIRPLIEKCVIYLYKEHFIAKFKKFGLNNFMEDWLKTDLDSDGQVGSTPAGSAAIGKPGEPPVR